MNNCSFVNTGTLYLLCVCMCVFVCVFVCVCMKGREDEEGDLGQVFYENPFDSWSPC